MFGFINGDGTALNALAPPVRFDPGKFVSQNIQFTFSTGSGEFERGTDLGVIFGSSSMTSVEVIPQVPLPAAVWLFGSALLGVIGFGCRGVVGCGSLIQVKSWCMLGMLVSARC